jgi:hypothetical protein
MRESSFGRDFRAAYPPSRLLSSIVELRSPWFGAVLARQLMQQTPNAFIGREKLSAAKASRGTEAA